MSLRRESRTPEKFIPLMKAIDEEVHIIKLDVNHELGGFQIEDNFRAEFYDLGTSRARCRHHSNRGRAARTNWSLI